MHSHWASAVAMGFMDYLSDLYESLTVQSAEAEEPQKEESGMPLSPFNYAEGGVGLSVAQSGVGVRVWCGDMC